MDYLEEICGMQLVTWKLKVLTKILMRKANLAPIHEFTFENTVLKTTKSNTICRIIFIT